MNIQRYNGQGEDMWPPVGDRPRQWMGTNAWGECFLQFWPVVQIDHDYPPTIVLTDAEWQEQHEDIYGLDLTGRVVVDADKAGRDIRTIPGYLPS